MKDHDIEAGNVDKHIGHDFKGSSKRNLEGKQGFGVLAEITLDDDIDQKYKFKSPGKGKDSQKRSSPYTTPSSLNRSKPKSMGKNKMLHTILPPMNVAAAAADDDSNEIEDRHQCDECWFASDSKEELVEHCRIKHVSLNADNIAKKPAPEESVVGSDNVLDEDDKRKVRLVSTDTVFSMKCLLCSFTTAVVQEMDDHFGKRGHFAAGKTVICTHCPFIGASEDELIGHGKSHFEGFSLAQYFCSRCVYVSNTIAKMDEHWMVSHN